MFVIYLMNRIPLDESRQLLDSRNDDMCFRIFQLSLQNGCRSVTVRSTLLEAVILFHGLIVQILSVNHKEYLVNIRQLRCQTRCFKRRQCFPGTGRVPNIPATFNSPVLLIVMCNFDPIQNAFSRRNLIRAHDHEHIFGCENAIPG